MNGGAMTSSSKRETTIYNSVRNTALKLQLAQKRNTTRLPHHADYYRLAKSKAADSSIRYRTAANVT